MIKSFKCKETEKIFKRNLSKKFPHDIQRSALKKLRMINRANMLNDLRVPLRTILNLYSVNEKDSTVLELMISGEYALNGQMAKHEM